MKFTKTTVLSSFRAMKSGGHFAIQDKKFFSINDYTFNQFAQGNYDSIEFIDDGVMAPNPAFPDREPLGQTRVKEGGIIETTRAKKLSDIDEAKLDVELKKVKNELATL